jgi:hypothetical protein
VLRRSFEYDSQPSYGSRILSGPRIARDSRSGEMVSIVERRTDGVAGARASSCLIFSTDAGFTRVWFYPSNWQRLKDDELIELTERWRHSRSA